MQLPDFIYHPNPIATGVIVPSERVCICCQQARGFIYDGPVYAIDEYEGCFCPWCIADGTAHEKYDVCFFDAAGVGNFGNRKWEPVSQDVIDTIVYRTPSFAGWQQEQWWTHCQDAAEFIAVVGFKELVLYGKQAFDAIALEIGLEGQELDRYMKALNKHGSPAAYLFCCRHCGAFGGYSDCD